MATKVHDLISSFEMLWPPAGAEEWDRPGLAVGNPHSEVAKVLLSVDATFNVISQAQRENCQLLLVHHPPFLKTDSLLSTDRLKGGLLSLALQSGVAIYAAHTNADIVQNGVSDVFAKAIGLIDSQPLVPTGNNTGHGRIGKLSETSTLKKLAEQISNSLPATNAPIRVAGNLDQPITSVAVVGGAGDSFIFNAQQLGADVLVTSDLRHHVSLDAIEHPSKPLALIDVSHYAAESLWLKVAKEQLEVRHPEIEFLISTVSTDPWSMTIGGSK